MGLLCSRAPLVARRGEDKVLGEDRLSIYLSHSLSLAISFFSNSQNSKDHNDTKIPLKRCHSRLQTIEYIGAAVHSLVVLMARQCS